MLLVPVYYRVWNYKEDTFLNSFDNHAYPDEGISKVCLVNELDESLLLVASSKHLLLQMFFFLQQSGYLFASSEISSIMAWDLDKEQLVNTTPTSLDCSISALFKMLEVLVDLSKKKKRMLEEVDFAHYNRNRN
ncbi:hypothetical protein HAX54_001434 [Datura stramonium]|uniref:Uncharacterized protein n=1 Tax=Datura stramonium TaxID=4076 RepID=A0ABS8WV98_DATST|nr:hypothetical protein [Datura stramonium]